MVDVKLRTTVKTFMPRRGRPVKEFIGEVRSISHCRKTGDLIIRLAASKQCEKERENLNKLAMKFSVPEACVAVRRLK